MSYIYIYIYIYMERPFLMFLDHTQRRTTVGRTSLDEWSARRRDLYLTTHNSHNRKTSIPPVGFEPTIISYRISAGERPQTYALERAATGTGIQNPYMPGIHTLNLLHLHFRQPLKNEPFLTITLTLRRLMSYLHGAPILDVSRSQTTTQHSR